MFAVLYAYISTFIWNHKIAYL